MPGNREKAVLSNVVSIRARPNERAMLGRLERGRPTRQVSIRARPNERAMHSAELHDKPLMAFQSAPAQMSGRCKTFPGLPL